MGQITSTIKKPFRNFNVVHRAARVLERRQAVAEPSPHHPSTADKLSQFRKEHPELLEAQKTKNEKLDQHLKHIHVESTGNVHEINKTTKPPINRKAIPETEMGSMEQHGEVPAGRSSLSMVFKMLSQHQSDPAQFTAQTIASEYKLDEKDVGNILKYHKLFQLHIPKSMYEDKKLKKHLDKMMDSGSGVFRQFTFPSQSTDQKEKLPSDSPEDLSATGNKR